MSKKQRNEKTKVRSHIIDIHEMREHKVKATVYIILRVIIVAVLIYSVIRGKWENTLTCALSFLLLMIPSFIENQMKIDLPNVMEVIMILFVFSANIMGEMAAFYEKIPIWDTLLHTMNGFICAGVGFGLIDILNSNDKIKMNLSPIFVCLFSFCFSMTVGTVWEFFEFGMDMFFGKDMQKDTVVNYINSYLLSGESNQMIRIKEITDTVVNGESLGINGYLDIGLIDTMKDMLVNFVGAVVFNFAGFFYLKHRGKHAGFVRNFIPRRKK
ncbi:MAG: hypothetical protein U0L76_03420 [Ruminococcus sp.]|nr:hypothetical protein [Ruminococcus sp.]